MALKTRELKTRESGVENSAANCRSGKDGSEKHDTRM